MDAKEQFIVSDRIIVWPGRWTESHGRRMSTLRLHDANVAGAHGTVVAGLLREAKKATVSACGKPELRDRAELMQAR